MYRRIEKQNRLVKGTSDARNMDKYVSPLLQECIMEAECRLSLDASWSDFFAVNHEMM